MESEQSHFSLAAEPSESGSVAAETWSELIEELNAYELRPESEDDEAEELVNEGNERSERRLCALGRLFVDCERATSEDGIAISGVLQVAARLGLPE